MYNWIKDQQSINVSLINPNPSRSELDKEQGVHFSNYNPVYPQSTGFHGLFSLPVTQKECPPETAECLNAIVTTNKQLTASLARQALPKCHPDTFGGDALLFHPWKKAFKAMIKNAEVPPEQEINYLRQYTKGEAQKLVDSYRTRQHKEPTLLLRQLWQELENRFGNTAIIASTLIKRLHKAAKFNEKESKKFQAFADVCSELDSQLEFLPGLACLNYPNAISPILEKLPPSLRSKWEKEVVNYAEDHQNAYLGFHEFTSIINRQANLRNHPNIVASFTAVPRDPKPREEGRSSSAYDPETKIFATRADPPEEPSQEEALTEKDAVKRCLFHDKNGHDLTNCKAFARKTLSARMEWIKQAKLCFRCFLPGHQANSCKSVVKCNKCGSPRHQELLHMEKKRESKDKDEENDDEEVSSNCTMICQEKLGGLSCAKIILLDVFQEKQPQHTYRVYAIIDDQSNVSMISTELANKFGASGPRERFLLSTCNAEKETQYGRHVVGLRVKSLQDKELKLPTLIECDHLPDKSEIPTPEIARSFNHLRPIADQIPPIDPNANIEILIGRDAPELLKVRAFRNGPRGAPWAQRLKLGWTISGQVCLNRISGPVHISVKRTSVSTHQLNQPRTGYANKISTPNLQDASSYDITPCSNHFVVKDIAPDIYHTTAEDNQVSLSQEDRRFLEIMNKRIHKNKFGNWEMPLPFCTDVPVVPNNRHQALTCLNNLLRSFKRKPQLEKDYFNFMAKILDRRHAVRVPPSKSTAASASGRVWYLSHFGVYHPRKPTQLRVVFDSSAEYQGISLKKMLLPGPDQMNSLFGVLVRFRQEEVALMYDIEQMFHSFYVTPEDQDFLRFLWFKDNNPSETVVEYRMAVHLFGNASSPAIATFGLGKTAKEAEEEFGTAAKNFVHNDFYVDDGLTSQANAKEAITLVKSTQAMLATARLRLHKIVSNSVTVMEALPMEDRGKSVQDLDFRQDSLPSQRSLGVQWDLEKDIFTFSVTLFEKPFTRRGLLSVINSVYDPLGVAAPVVMRGKLLLRKLVILGKKENKAPLGWDDPLPEDLMTQWSVWKKAMLPP